MPEGFTPKCKENSNPEGKKFLLLQKIHWTLSYISESINKRGHLE